MRAATISIEDQDGTYRTLAKLLPYKDGGFGLVPLFPIDRIGGVLLLELPTAYDAPGFWASRNSLHMEYRSVSPIKLSIHGDGYVQFSRSRGNGIISGREGASGRPRGFGYQGPSVASPPTSGPTFGMTAWGIQAYPASTSTRANTLRVPRSRLNVYASRVADKSAYALEFWLMPRTALRASRLSSGLLTLAHPPHPHYGGQPFEFLIVDVGNPFSVAGLVVTVFETQWRAPAGMTLGAPADLSHQKALQAIAPIPDTYPSVPSADYDDTALAPLARRSVVPNVRREWTNVREIPE